LISELDGRPIGFIQIIYPAQEDSHYWGGVLAHLRAIDIWIGEPTELSKDYSTTMIRLALARCFADPEVTAVLIDRKPVQQRLPRFCTAIATQRVSIV
jgi:aminoglycoside 6'-N-acetyltransferase